jgi:predicted nucleic acid-binding protein
VILVDSNILIDLFSHDAQWYDWSREQIGRAAHGAYLFVNPIVVGELSWKFESFERFTQILTALLIGIEPFDGKAGHCAGDAYHRYRLRRGEDSPKLPLPDFLIGGHAQSLGATILTRDARFYRVYFPQVPLILPETIND